MQHGSTLIALKKDETAAKITIVGFSQSQCTMMHDSNSKRALETMKDMRDTGHHQLFSLVIIKIQEGIDHDA